MNVYDKNKIPIRIGDILKYTLSHSASDVENGCSPEPFDEYKWVLNKEICYGRTCFRISHLSHPKYPPDHVTFLEDIDGRVLEHVEIVQGSEVIKDENGKIKIISFKDRRK